MTRDNIKKMFMMYNRDKSNSLSDAVAFGYDARQDEINELLREIRELKKVIQLQPTYQLEWFKKHYPKGV